MKIVKESISFKRKEDPYDSLNIGTLNKIHEAKIKEEREEMPDIVFCSKYGYIDWVNFLIHNNVDINDTGNTFGGYTALIWAAIHGYFDIVELLINAGANLEDKENNGLTALKYCLSIKKQINLYPSANENNLSKCIEILRKYGAKE